MIVDMGVDLVTTIGDALRQKEALLALTQGYTEDGTPAVVKPARLLILFMLSQQSLLLSLSKHCLHTHSRPQLTEAVPSRHQFYPLSPLRSRDGTPRENYQRCQRHHDPVLRGPP